MEAVKRSLQAIDAFNREIKSALHKPARGILRYPYLSAGTGDSYPDLTDWETIWSGIGYMRTGDHHPLRDSMWNLLDHMQPDGKGQRRIGASKYSAPVYQCRPFVACGAYALCREIGVDWLRSGDLEKLNQHLLYWHNHRVGREGLLRWLHVDEGFADNGLCNWCWEGNSVQAVDLNAQLVREHLALHRVMNLCGDSASAETQMDFARKLVHRINASLWDESDECYYSLYNPPPRHEPSSMVRVKGYNNLWPLWIGITPKDRASRVIERYILDRNEFRSAYGIRSMSRSERFYNNLTHGMANPMPGAPLNGQVAHSWCSNWQGPVWTVPTWLSVKALRNYGYEAEAAQLASDYLNHVAERLRRDGAYYENYHAETGEPLKAAGIGSWYVLLPSLTDESEDEFFPVWTE